MVQLIRVETKMKKLLIILLFLTTIINAQFLELMQNNVSNTELNSSPTMTGSWTTLYQSDWSSAESMSETNGTGSANNDGISDGTTSYDNTYKYYANATSGSHYASVSLGQSSGDLCRLTGSFYFPNANTHANGFTISNSLSAAIVISGTIGYYASPYTNNTGQWKNLDVYVAFDNSNATRFWEYSNGTSIFTGSNSSSDDIMYLYNVKLEKQVLPNGWTGTALSKANHILCLTTGGVKLVEATGETKLTMTDTLDVGYYKIKVIQDWTQGKLWIYNGTTTYNLPQSDGDYAVKIYADGIHPIVIGCDNNTISSLSSLSIK